MTTKKQKYYSQTKFNVQFNDSLMYEIKTEMSMKILTLMNKCLILVIIQVSQNIVMIQTNWSFEK